MKNNLTNIFKNKKILITGHTGFKGSWLCAWLHSIGADIHGIALEPPSNPSHYDLLRISKDINDIRMDIKDLDLVKKEITNIKPDFVFHMAAQALVNDAYIDPIKTWQTNLMGTVNILESLRELKNECNAIIITSDKCYNNQEWIWGYREHDKLGGPDPYSASKGAAEIAINSYYMSYFNKIDSPVKIASARAGNVIGGGDWAKDRIVPDCVRKWAKNETVELRNPNSTRPWQHVLEPLSGYLTLASRLVENRDINGESFNFGPDSNADYSVKDLVVEIARIWGSAKWRDNSEKLSVHESSLLKLNCDKAMSLLGWKSKLNFIETAEYTANWYKSFFDNKEDIYNLTINQIKNYSLIS
ncbi:CDP-glucose 4,6-dehydratase [Pelagibacterales bacterium]|nr:CDP-glucose 4,6-dehydratase [Pelagibacterales bacterium]